MLILQRYDEKRIYVIPLHWFEESIEEYNYRQKPSQPLASEPKAYKTTFEKDALPKFKIEVSYGSTQKLKSKDEHALVPITYRRNYEEFLGLFKKGTNNAEKSITDNYENNFIGLNKNLKKIADDFVAYINTFDLKYMKDIYDTTGNNKKFEMDAIKKRVENDAKLLWEESTKAFKSNFNSKSYDDRPLYWARLKMQSQLKRLPIFKGDLDFENSQVKKGTKLDEIITIFEEKSRNYTGINFGTTHTGKKILITGYDPFILNEFDNKKLIGSANILQSNPSGCVAQYLAVNNLQNSKVQTMLFPVRYADFDQSDNPEKGQGEGIVEKYIKPWLSKVDMIFTISQAGVGDYHLDVYATATRGGFNDNVNFLREEDSMSVSNQSPETIVTTLPDSLVNSNSIAMFYGKYFETKQDEIDYYNGNLAKQKNSDKSNYPTNKVYSAPGGNYLSDEIFYRVAKMRKETIPTLETGHFHIEKLQGSNEDFNQNKTEILIKNILQVFNSAGL